MNDEPNRDLRRARARFCYADVAGWPESWRKDAMRRARGLPVEVRTLGLMVALAKMMSEKNTAADHLADLLAEWLLDRSPNKVFRTVEASPAALLAECAKAPRTEYAAAQREAILLYDQLKIYADALYSNEREGTGAAS